MFAYINEEMIRKAAIKTEQGSGHSVLEHINEEGLYVQISRYKSRS